MCQNKNNENINFLNYLCIIYSPLKKWQFLPLAGSPIIPWSTIASSYVYSILFLYSHLISYLIVLILDWSRYDSSVWNTDFSQNFKIEYAELCTGCSLNIVFFPIHCKPSLAYIAVRDLQSSQHNASVQSLLLAGNFLYNQ